MFGKSFHVDNLGRLAHAVKSVYLVKRPRSVTSGSAFVLITSGWVAPGIEAEPKHEENSFERRIVR